MATTVIMPRQGQSVESCVITAWNKKVGDAVAEGDVLFSYETDKSSFDELAPCAGTMLAVFAEEGDDVVCLEPVCIIGAEGEDISSLMPGKAEEAKPAEEAPKAEASAEAPKMEATATAPVSAEGRMKISPRAKNLAARTDADLSKAIPTGPDGRIIERDVNLLLDEGKLLSNRPAAPAAEAPAQSAPVAAAPAAAYEDVKLTGIRKTIAKNMVDSLQNLAQLTLNTSFDATKLLAYRKTVKANAEKLGLPDINLNDMVMYAVVKTLQNHKTLNAHYLDKEGVMRLFTDVNLGIACDTDRGLLVPVVFGANAMSLAEFTTAAKAVVKTAKDGTISPDAMKGGSFTVTNLGSMGIESFTPVINPPQTGILGVCATTMRMKEVGGEMVSYPAMGLSLTFDHRALDGAPAARFLKELCMNLENFDLLMAK